HALRVHQEEQPGDRAGAGGHRAGQERGPGRAGGAHGGQRAADRAGAAGLTPVHVPGLTADPNAATPPPAVPTEVADRGRWFTGREATAGWAPGSSGSYGRSLAIST